MSYETSSDALQKFMAKMVDAGVPNTTPEAIVILCSMLGMQTQTLLNLDKSLERIADAIEALDSEGPEDNGARGDGGTTGGGGKAP